MADASQTPDAAVPLSQLKIDRKAISPRRKLRWGRWLALALVFAVIAVFIFMPRKVEVQVTSVLTSYPSQQYAELTASGYVVAQRRARSPPLHQDTFHTTSRKPAWLEGVVRRSPFAEQRAESTESTKYDKNGVFSEVPPFAQNRGTAPAVGLRGA